MLYLIYLSPVRHEGENYRHRRDFLVLIREILLDLTVFQQVRYFPSILRLFQFLDVFDSVLSGLIKQ